jgi:hypothetical protein
MKESGLWVVGASGGVPRQVWVSDVAAGTGATQVYAWTEDGTGIAVARSSTDVSIIDVTSGAVKRISGPAQVHGIAFRAKRPSVVIAEDQDVPLPSPTGPRGAPGNVGRPGEVAVRDTWQASSRIVYQHDNVGTLLWEPQWNPASDEVLLRWVCGAGAAGRFELVIVNAVTRAVRALATQECVYSSSWSGDGTRVLYSDLSAVRVMKADGSGDRELFRPPPPSRGMTYVGELFAFAPR